MFSAFLFLCNGKIHTSTINTRGPKKLHKSQPDRVLEHLSSRGWVCGASSSHLPSTVCTALQYRKMILLWRSRCWGKLQDKKLKPRKQSLMLLACFSCLWAAPQAASRSLAKISTHLSHQSQFESFVELTTGRFAHRLITQPDFPARQTTFCCLTVLNAVKAFSLNT